MFRVLLILQLHGKQGQDDSGKMYQETGEKRSPIHTYIVWCNTLHLASSMKVHNIDKKYN